MATSSNDITQLTELALSRAIEYLLDARDPQGHWRDVRSTAVAVWALRAVVQGRNVSNDHAEYLLKVIRDASVWLAGQAKSEAGGVNWESEAWDTSLSVIALAPSDDFDDKLDLAVAWLESIRCVRTGVWYDEVWETTLATIAILERESVRSGPPRETDHLVKSVLGWLVNIPSKSSGEFISPHYSGFLVWLDAAFQKHKTRSSTLTSELYMRFRTKADSAARWLLSEAKDHPDELWCPYTFSNAYVAHALSLHPTYRNELLSHTIPILDWFRDRQGRSGSYEDTEDTSLAILALSAMVDLLETTRGSLLRRLGSLNIEKHRKDIRCFLGYAARSRSLALDIKDIIRSNVPNITLVDWVWDLRPGRILMDELESLTKDCSMALFLITMDDHTEQGGVQTSSPRDNVVFEVGFFSGRLGRDRTVMIVEQGTTLPSDWAGVLYLSFRDRNDLSSLQTGLIRSISSLITQR